MSGPPEKDGDKVSAIAKQAYEELARTFPVCCFSDEFYYFPQATPEKQEWEWDRFQPEAVEETATRLSRFETELETLPPDIGNDPAIDAALLRRVFQTLRQQLVEVRSHEDRPTFYLTVLSVGMAQAYAKGGKEALRKRAAGVPFFLQTAERNLQRPPEIFRQLGLEMVPSTRSYLDHLNKDRLPELTKAISAVERFGEKLGSVPVRDDFRLSPGLFDKVVRLHMDCGEGTDEVEAELDDEIRKMEERLVTRSRLLSGKESWLEAVAGLPGPALPEGGALELFQEVVDALGRHCLAHGLVTPELYQDCPVRVGPVPSYLASIRTASAYSMEPGHPPRGGSFYVINATGPKAAMSEDMAECRMLAAHETWPGHHLLDMNRWLNRRPLRRPLEHPLFYEGWACFAEELAARTGHLSRPEDRLLLDKRRYWRAVRGKVDLGLQTGSLDLGKAAGLLTGTGMTTERARATAPRFALNPGYQLCYTLGLKRFLELFRKFGQDNLPGFVKTVMDQGEIGFRALTAIMES
jgi:hypothetical protein